MGGSAQASSTSAARLPVNGGVATTPPRRGLKHSTPIALILIVVVVVSGSFGASYLMSARNYVSSGDNAEIAGDKIAINAPASDILLGWRANQSVAVHKDKIVGRIGIQGRFVQPQVPIRARANGTVAVDNCMPYSYVPPGPSSPSPKTWTRSASPPASLRPTFKPSAQGSLLMSPWTRRPAGLRRSRTQTRRCSRHSRNVTAAGSRRLPRLYRSRSQSSTVCPPRSRPQHECHRSHLQTLITVADNTARP